MKRFLLSLVLAPCIVFGQYNAEDILDNRMANLKGNVLGNKENKNNVV